MTKKHATLLTLGGLLALGMAGGARAGLHTTYKAQTSVTPAGVSLRDIAVNRNAGSKFYGTVYATSVSDNKVHIFRPERAADGTGSATLVDTGLTISASAGTNLFGVAVGEDDSVWLGVFGTGNIESAPPAPLEGTDVVATPQFMVTGGIRGIAMTGTLDNATIWVQTNDTKAKMFTGSTTAWNTAGTFSEQHVADLKTISANIQVGYGIGVDSAGNAYVGLSYNAAGADAPLVAKVKTDGTIDTEWGGKRPAFTTIANSLADADVVEDANLPGGGYVYFSARQVTGGVNKRIVHRYRLDNGAWLDSFGPDAAAGFTPPEDATYTVLDVTNGSSPHYFGADDKGNLYFNAGSQTIVQKIAASQAFLVAAGAKTSAGDLIKSSPTAVDGIVYFGASDGKLYAYEAETGNPVDGFPVDVADQLNQPGEQILSRPAVYYTDPDGEGGAEPVKGIYFTTSGGFVCRVNPDGTGLQHNVVSLNSGGVSATPAVLADGTVFVGLYDGNAARVYKFSPDLSDFLASDSLGFGNMTSVAVAGNNVFVGLASGVSPKLVVLNAATLTPLNSFNGEGVSAPPYVSEGSMYFGTLAGNFYKVNAATGAPDTAFGTDGAVHLGAPISTSPFRPVGGPFLVATDAGAVWSVGPENGASVTFYETGETGAPIGGLVATFESLGFGTASGVFYVIPSDNEEAQVYRGHGPFTGTPTYDASARRFLLGSDDGNLYSFVPRAPTAEPR